MLDLMKSEIRTAAILFGGIGGFSAGLKRSLVEAYGKVYRWEILCSIDFDPVACRNHDIITGEQTAVQMDLFDRDHEGNPIPKKEQVKMCGNSVPPQFAEALTRANLPELCDLKVAM